MERKLIRKNVKRNRVMACVFFFAALLWMVVIFNFSAQDSKESTKTSDPITNAVAERIEPEYNNEEKNGEFETVYRLVSKVVRKTAHILAYAFLAVLWYFAAGTAYGVSHSYYKPAFISIPICVIYAALDEYHQTFVAGRSGKITDVLIDGIGVLLGTLAAMVVVRQIRRYILKKENSTKRGE